MKTESVKKQRFFRSRKLIMRAAFCFSLISSFTTAKGMSQYIFDEFVLAIFASFGIQMLLFVFNLNLPLWFNQISTSTLFGKKLKYINHVIIGLFYSALLICSSGFSFVYICDDVNYHHKSGYVDDSIELSSTYREKLNLVTKYVSEEKKVLQMLGSKYIQDISKFESTLEISDVPYVSGTKYDTFSTNQLKIEKSRLENEIKNCNTKIDELNQKINDYRSSRYYSEENRKDFDRWIEEKESFTDTLTRASSNLEIVNALLNQKSSSNSGISNEFLVQMLSDETDPKEMQDSADKLNKLIMQELNDSDKDINQYYVDLIIESQNINNIIQDYTKLLQIVSISEQDVNESKIDYNTNELHNNSIQNLQDLLKKVIPVPDPKNKTTFKKDLNTWQKEWDNRLNRLVSLYQNIPMYSENYLKELKNGSYSSSVAVDEELLSQFSLSNVNKHIRDIESLKRRTISDMNIIESGYNHLFASRYKFSAIISLLLALGLDLFSLLAGLFLAWVDNKEKS